MQTKQRSPMQRTALHYCTLILITICVVAVPSSRAADVRVGLAAVDITPPLGYRMSGYFSERVSTAVHDPLFAKAMVFSQGGTKAVLVICDLIGVPKEVAEPAAMRIGERLGTTADHVIIAATHTHTGPLYYGTMRTALHERALATHDKDPCEPIDYSAFLINKLTEAAEKADTATRPAQLLAAAGKQAPTLSFHRRYLMKDGSVQFNPGKKADIVRPAGPIDPDVNVLVVREPGDASRTQKTLAALTVFAMHLDTTGGTEFSADYPFYLETALRERFGPDFVSVFGLGPCGNINHVDPFADKRRAAGELGRMLAGTVERMAADLRPVEPTELAVCAARVAVPLQHYSAEQIAQARERIPLIGTGRLKFLEEVEAYKIVDLQTRGEQERLPIRAMRLGRDLAIVSLPGEIFVELGLAIKQASPFKQTIVLELANDNIAYVPTREAFNQGSYEPTNSRIAPGGGEKLVEAAIRLLQEMHKKL